MQFLRVPNWACLEIGGAPKQLSFWFPLKPNNKGVLSQKRQVRLAHLHKWVSVIVIMYPPQGVKTDSNDPEKMGEKTSYVMGTFASWLWSSCANSLNFPNQKNSCPMSLGFKTIQDPRDFGHSIYSFVSKPMIQSNFPIPFLAEYIVRVSN